MKNLALILTIPLASIASALVLIAVAGFIKFNLLDIPYFGDPATYQIDSGEEIIVQLKADDLIEISSFYFKTFHLKRSASASGERYTNKDKNFVFWRKGDSMFIERNKEITFRGTLKQPSYAE
ncbi:MAG: MliC family protein [Pseudomonadales bacterium]